MVVSDDKTLSLTSKVEHKNSTTTIQNFCRTSSIHVVHIIYIYDDDGDFVLFQVHQLDNYKDRSPGLHMWTLPSLIPTTHSLVHHQNCRKEKEKKENIVVI